VGRGGEGEVAREGWKEGLKERERKERGEKGGREGDRNLDPQCSRQIDATERKGWQERKESGMIRRMIQGRKQIYGS
jgi:hypothetical protein